MSEKVKLIIEIPKELYEKKKGYLTNMDAYMICKAVRNGTTLDSVKAEIKKKCDCIDDIARAYIYQYAPHREIQDLLSEILTSIDNAESIDPNDMTRMFEGVTEWPKDAFKGWTTEELLEQIRAESEGK